MHQALARAPVREVEVGVEPAFDFLSDEYRDFYRPGRATAFQAPLWMHMLHTRLAPGLGATQRTVTVRDRLSGALVAVLPMIAQRSAGVTIVQPADFGVCDYNSVVADRARLLELSADPDLRRALHATFAGADVVMFRKLRADDFDVSLLLGPSHASEGENAAYRCETGGDFDHWRSKVLRKKFTKELGRLQRQTERDHGGYEHRLVADEAGIRRVFDFLRDVQGRRRQGGLLSNPLYFEFYRDCALAGAASGEALTYASYVAGEPAAALFGPAGDGDFHAVLIGFDPRFERISAGTQIIYRVVEQRMQAGHATFDMGLGDPGYKVHFRPEVTPMRNVTMSMTPTGAAVSFIYHRSKPLKNLLKGFMPNVR